MQSGIWSRASPSAAPEANAKRRNGGASNREKTLRSNVAAWLTMQLALARKAVVKNRRGNNDHDSGLCSKRV